MAFKEQKKIPVLHVCDFETGGLDASKCGVTQWTVQLVRCDDWSTIDTFNVYVKPYSKTVVKKESKKRLKSKFDDDSGTQIVPMEYTEGALNVTGITIDMLEEQGIDVVEAVDQYLNFLESNKLEGGMKPLVCGQNITFDIDFLFAFLDNHPEGMKRFSKLVQGKKYKAAGEIWFPHYIDTLPLGRSALYHKLETFGLEVLCENEGIEVETAHNALYDVDANARLFRSYLTKMSGSGEAVQQEEKEKTRKHFKF